VTENRRPKEEIDREASDLATVYVQNEATRDAFLALAHTALFAASVSFVSDLAKSGHTRLLCLLILAWSSNVVGLFALTLSYPATRQHILERQKRIWDAAAPNARYADLLNGIALWTLPIALLCTFVFATANVLP
jgi:hypothetical protein